ncbi:MAG TPA: hypothetical protein VKT49_23130 [Bryobacteraceae bacterium]|nr:hypothetical protein [Bryobacteraceae bacterium]
MMYLTLSLECECGRSAASVQEVGFTNDHQLILRWRCTRCKKHAFVLKPLEECWKECPVESGDAVDDSVQHSHEEIRQTDAEFLQAIGVTIPE